MKNWIWGIALTGLAAACSSSPETPSRPMRMADDGHENMSERYEPEVNFENDRTYMSTNGGAWEATSMARVPAQSPIIVEEPASRTVTISRDGEIGRFSLAVAKVMRWSERVPVQRTRMELRSFVEDGYCDSYQCDSEGGQSPLWNTFYSAPKAQKPAALADAIRGIGVPSAQKLVDAGYFHRKPRTWSAFEDEVERAERSGVIDSNARYATLTKYRLDNLINLGYTETACRVVQKRCKVVVERLVPVPYTDYETRDYSKVVETIVRDVEIVVSGSRLQSFESDAATVTVGWDRDNVRVNAGPYTRYSTQISHEGSLVRIALLGEERIPAALPASVLKSGLLALGNPPTLKVTLDPRYVPANAGDDQMVLKYTLEGCKMNIFGGCLGMKVMDQGVVPVTGELVSVPMTKAMKGYKMQAKYSVSRRNSVFYTNGYIAERETDDIKWK